MQLHRRLFSWLPTHQSTSQGTWQRPSMAWSGGGAPFDLAFHWIMMCAVCLPYQWMTAGPPTSAFPGNSFSHILHLSHHFPSGNLYLQMLGIEPGFCMQSTRSGTEQQPVLRHWVYSAAFCSVRLINFELAAPGIESGTSCSPKRHVLSESYSPWAAGVNTWGLHIKKQTVG